MHTPSVKLWLRVILTAASFCLSHARYTIPVPATVPSRSSHVVDRSFTGFAFEQAAFYNYAFNETGQPNVFSQNLINSVLSRTAGAPLLRVGGTSGDRGQLDENLESPTNCSEAEHSICFGGPNHPSLSVGPSFFDAFKNFPGAQYDFMVPLYHRNLNNTIEWTRLGLDAIGDESLYALEIGNEPDQYPWFSTEEYVREYRRFESALKESFPALQNNKIFQSLDTSSGHATSLSVLDAFNSGLNKNNTSMKQVAYHYYQGYKTPTSFSHLQLWILHYTTAAQLNSYKNDITRAHNHSMNFVLSEVGDSLGSGVSDNLEWQNTLATALWTVDFQLHAITIGVDRVNMQHLIKPSFCMWDPVKSRWGPPAVRANYYSQPYVADFIGPNGNTSVAALNITHADGRLAAYAAYDSGKLSRIAVVNLDLWRLQDGGRRQAHVTLDGLPDTSDNATIHYLTAANGTFAKNGLTWKGLEWTYDSNGLENKVKNDTQQISIQNGKLELNINATSAVMVEL